MVSSVTPPGHALVGGAVSGALNAGTTGALLLALAGLRLAARGMRSRRDSIRTEAEQFWENPAAVTMWADVLDVDPATLTRAVVGRRGQR
jgi:hypothetical protein